VSHSSGGAAILTE